MILTMIGGGQAWAQKLAMPSAIFLQDGEARRTREISAGAAWDWDWTKRLGPGLVTGYLEMSISRWSYTGSKDRPIAWLNQIGLIPVFRYRPDAGASPWFLECAVGLTLMSTIYETDRKRFSTNFNFGDHVAIGLSFGSRREHEIMLRVEHFSNGGIKEPNPGVNMTQVRYTIRFE